MQSSMWMMLLFTVIVGVVVFGGLTLTYFWDKRGNHPAPAPVRVDDDEHSPARTDDRRHREYEHAA